MYLLWYKMIPMFTWQQIIFENYEKAVWSYVVKI